MYMDMGMGMHMDMHMRMHMHMHMHMHACQHVRHLARRSAPWVDGEHALQGGDARAPPDPARTILACALPRRCMTALREPVRADGG